MTLDQAADILDVTPGTVARMVRAGLLQRAPGYRKNLKRERGSDGRWCFRAHVFGASVRSLRAQRVRAGLQ